jgi:hypothetical protein
VVKLAVVYPGVRRFLVSREQDVFAWTLLLQVRDDRFFQAREALLT